MSTAVPNSDGSSTSRNGDQTAKRDDRQADASAHTSEDRSGSDESFRFGHFVPNATRDHTLIPKPIADEEASELRCRRRVMFGDVADQTPDTPISDPVGLALSGGGIRSASFSLGLLQAFVEKGFIRWVDYLSTVSGGGFMGTHLSTLLCSRAPKKLDKKLPLAHEKGDKLSEHVHDFIRGGRYLKDGPMMTDRFLMGFLLNFATWGSLLVLLTCGLAFTWRCVDYPGLVYWINDCCQRLTGSFVEMIRSFAPAFIVGWISDLHRSWYTDVTRPFIPFFAVIVLWVFSWIYTCKFRKFAPRYDAPRPIGRNLLRVAGVCLFVGAAVFLATDGIQLERYIGLEDDGSLGTRMNNHTVIGAVILFFVVVNLLLLFNPLKIIRSELRPPGKLEASILRVAGGTLFVLVPFYLTYTFAKEGISGYPRNRGPEFVAVDIPFPFKFLEALNEQGAARPSESSAEESGEQSADPSARDDVMGRYLHDVLNKELTNFTLEDHKQVTQGIPGAFWEDVKEGNLKEVLGESFKNLEDDRVRSELRFILDCPFLDDVDLLVFLGRELARKREGSPVVPYSLSLFARRACACYIAAILNDHVLKQTRATDLAIRQVDDDTSRDVSDATVDSEPDDVFLDRAASLRDASRFKSLWPKAVMAGGALPEKDRIALNRLVLEAYYAGIHVEERRKAGYSLNWWEDQQYRLWWLGGAAIVFFICGWFVDMNATSLHGFYRKKLEDAYVVHRERHHGKKRNDGVPLKDLKTTSVGGPYHFLCATLNFFDAWPWKLTEYSSSYTFFFSRLYCGSQALCKGEERSHRADMDGYARTETYCDGQLDVTTAAAISGAAFSPAILRTPLLFCMSLLLNVRLGQWLPNPACTRKPRLSSKTCKITAAKVLCDFVWTLFGKRKPSEWRYCFVTDGGHNDNLGISPLIFRRCRLVIVSDATRDPQYHFTDFLKAFRRYRIRGGMNFCRLETLADWVRTPDRPALLDLAPLSTRRVKELDRQERLERTGQRSRRLLTAARTTRAARRVREDRSRRIPDCSNSHFLLSKITYAEKKAPATILVYLKSTMTGDEPADLMQYQIDNPQFPHDPTTDQFFSENQVESYRQLGFHIGAELCDTIMKGRDLLNLKRRGKANLWTDNHSVDDIAQMLLVGYLDGRIHDDADELIAVLEEMAGYLDDRLDDNADELIAVLDKMKAETHLFGYVARRVVKKCPLNRKQLTRIIRAVAKRMRAVAMRLSILQDELAKKAKSRSAKTRGGFGAGQAPAAEAGEETRTGLSNELEIVLDALPPLMVTSHRKLRERNADSGEVSRNTLLRDALNKAAETVDEVVNLYNRTLRQPAQARACEPLKKTVDLYDSKQRRTLVEARKAFHQFAETAKLDESKKDPALVRAAKTVSETLDVFELSGRLERVAKRLRWMADPQAGHRKREPKSRPPAPAPAEQVSPSAYLNEELGALVWWQVVAQSETRDQVRANAVLIVFGAEQAAFQKMVGKDTRVAFVFERESEGQASQLYRRFWRGEEEEPHDRKSVSGTVVRERRERIELNVAETEFHEEPKKGLVAAYPVRVGANEQATCCAIEVRNEAFTGPHNQSPDKLRVELRKKLDQFARRCEHAIAACDRIYEAQRAVTRQAEDARAHQHGQTT